MAVPRHLDGLDPHMEASEHEVDGGAPVSVHFEAHPLKAPRTIEQEPQSIVISNLVPGKNLASALDDTHVTRRRGVVRWLSLSTWIILLESQWVLVALGVSVLLLLVCAAKLHGAPHLIP